jgi:apoptosis-inducing factor 3
MAESGWTDVCPEGDLTEGVPRLVSIGEEGIYLVRLDGAIYAVGHECTHYQGKLEDGVLIGSQVVCPSHNARFDVKTGRVLIPPAFNDLPVHPVRVEAGRVLLGAAVKPKFPKPEGADGRTFLIVGAGAAGSMAAETLRREGFAGRIILLTAEDERPYDRPNLSKDFITGKAKPEWMPLRSAKFYENQKIELRMGSRVTSLDPRRKTAVLQDGTSISFDAALLATGGVPRKLPIPGAGADCCLALRTWADARAIAAAAEKAGSAAVIGAGFLGLELASSLRDKGMEVHVIAPEALPLSHVLGERIAAFLKARHEAKGVTFHLGKTPTQLTGQPGAKTMVLSDGTRLSVDFVVYGLGIEPSVDYLAGTDLVSGGGVPVNRRLETRYPGVFAAGDIALVPDSTGEAHRIEHWSVAQRQGQHAARAMLGAAGEYAQVPYFWTKQAGASVKYVGHAREWDRIVYRGDVESGKFTAGFYRRGVLKAAAGGGKSRDIMILEEVLRLGHSPSPEEFADQKTDFMTMARG